MSTIALTHQIVGHNFERWTTLAGLYAQDADMLTAHTCGAHRCKPPFACVTVDLVFIMCRPVCSMQLANSDGVGKHC